MDLLNSLVVASVAVMIIGTEMFGSDGVSLPLWLVTAGMTASLLSLSLTAIIVHVFGGNAGREKRLWLLRVGYYSASLRHDRVLEGSRRGWRPGELPSTPKSERCEEAPTTAGSVHSAVVASEH